MRTLIPTYLHNDANTRRKSVEEPEHPIEVLSDRKQSSQEVPPANIKQLKYEYITAEEAPFPRTIILYMNKTRPYLCS